MTESSPVGIQLIYTYIKFYFNTVCVYLYKWFKSYFSPTKTGKIEGKCSPGTQ